MNSGVSYNFYEHYKFNFVRAYVSGVTCKVSGGWNIHGPLLGSRIKIKTIDIMRYWTLHGAFFSQISKCMRNANMKYSVKDASRSLCVKQTKFNEKGDKLSRDFALREHCLYHI